MAGGSPEKRNLQRRLSHSRIFLSRERARERAMRLPIDTRPFGPHPLLGLGPDELRWLAPVRPGDVLHLEGEVVELIPSNSKPQGIAKVRWTALNQRVEAVYTFTPLVLCRAARFGERVAAA